MLYQLWMFMGPDYVGFTDSKYILPSIEETYINMDVEIVCTLDGSTVKVYDIYAKAKIGELEGQLINTLTFRLYEVYNSKTHL